VKKIRNSGKFGSKPFNRSDSRGPAAHGGGFRTARRPYDRPGVEKRLFKATCDSCGAECEVPFKPSGERPVYCRDCFRKQEGGQPERGGRFERGGRPPFKRPERFEPRAPAAAQDSGKIMRELEKINEKLDMILGAMAGEEEEEGEDENGGTNVEGEEDSDS
jgi:CxxC-x17-CxxC domain-containing protein